MVGNMKKCILIMISILVVLFSFIACTNNSSSNNSAAVTNKYGGIYTKIKSHQQVIRVTQQKAFEYYRICYSKVSFSNIQNHSSKSESDNITSFESEISKNNYNTEILETTLKDNETTTKKLKAHQIQNPLPNHSQMIKVG